MKLDRLGAVRTETSKRAAACLSSHPILMSGGMTASGTPNRFQ